MNKPSRIKNNNRHNSLLAGIPSWLPSWSLAMLLAFSLAACDSVPTESTTDTGGNIVVTGYTGNACGTGATDPNAITEACKFKTEFWDNMPSVSHCVNCHNTYASNVSPYFLDRADANVSYAQVLSFNPFTQTPVCA